DGSGNRDRHGPLWDRCWPERYNYTARQEVSAAFAPQVQNGHILDQTMWNWYFDKGEAKLNPAGMAQLDYIVRRRPAPDPNLFLATARDIDYDPDNPDKLGETRRDLDSRRAEAVKRYLAAQTAGRPMTFEVMVHDPAEVGLPAEYIRGTYRLVTAPSPGGP